MILDPWQRPATLLLTASSLDGAPGVERIEDGEWFQWLAGGSTAPTKPVATSELLDRFCRLVRPTDDRHRLGLVRAFVDDFGPWAFCEAGDVHADFDAPGLRWPFVLGHDVVAQERLRLITTEPGTLAGRRALSALRPVGAGKRGVQWIPGLRVSAVRVNALRAIVAAVAQDRRPDPGLWRIVWPTNIRRPFRVRSLEDQRDGVWFILERWRQAEHVEVPSPIGTARVYGVAGALAIALRDEFEHRSPIARCEHRLADGHCGDIPTVDPRVERCGITWRPGRRANGGIMPTRCKACEHLHLVTKLTRRAEQGG